MTKVRYTREFKYGQSGPDVEGVGRALCRAHVYLPLAVFNRLPKRLRRTWGRGKQKALKRFKRKHGLPANFKYGHGAHAKLSRYFDARARHLMNEWHKPLPPAELHWKKLLAGMQQMNNRSAGYSYGAGHSRPLDSMSVTDYYDCSSSTSKALRLGGVFPREYALVSGDFDQWGEPGRGKYFTVRYHSGHAFIQLHKSRWRRFDTSPYGDPRSSRSGPRLRYLPRPTWGFGSRHWKGM